jgi:signal peptidase I
VSIVLSEDKGYNIRIMGGEKKDNFVKEILKFTIVVLAIVVPVRLFVAQPFVVSGASMDPTFASGQYLIVDQLSYRLSEPQRGDVIIFHYPKNPDTFFIKRIIGLPAEIVTIEEGGIIIQNAKNPDGFMLDEPYIDERNRTYEDFSLELGVNEYFVMGDNREQSSDSRIWGALEEKYIVGRPIVRLLPLSDMDFFPGKNENKE